MKIFSTLAAIALCSVSLTAQSFSSPESVEYDNVGMRWFVGQNGSGQIHVYSPGSGTLLPFASGLTSGPHGLEIMGNVLYVCDGASIKGFDLSSGSQVFNLNLGATFLNGLTTDGSTYLFATDFSAKRIYRVCPSAGTYNIMVTTVKTPNGIYYDGANNRCVFVTWGTNAAVQAMAMADSSVSTLITTTSSNMDGITRDAAGYWYVTTWGGNALRMFDPTFSAQPTAVMTGLSSPADIDINLAGDSIGIPNSGNANNVVFYTLPTGIPSLSGPENGTVYPSPATESIKIVLETTVQNGTAEVYDMAGNLVSKQAFSGNTCVINRDSFASGTYIVMIMKEDTEVLFHDKIVFKDRD
jgi:hypothetical protein